MSRPRLKILIAIVLLPLAVFGLVNYLTRSSGHPDLLAAEEAIARRQFREAGEYLANYLLIHPDDNAVQLLAAQTARRGGDFTVAFTHLTKCQQLNGPKEPMELEFRLLRMQQGRVTEASSLMEIFANRPQALETSLVMEAVVVGILNALAPDPVAPLSLTAAAIPLLIQARRAGDLWLDLRSDQADQVAGLFWRGRIHVMTGDYLNGIADLEKVVTIDPDNFKARMYLAFQIAQSNPTEATAHLAILRQQNPTNKQVAFGLATGYRGIGRLDDATKILDEMLGTNPDEVLVLVERGLVAMDLAQFADAERLLFRAYALSPDTPAVNLALSQYMQLRGETAKMREYRDRFLRSLEAQKRQQGNPDPKP